MKKPIKVYVLMRERIEHDPDVCGISVQDVYGTYELALAEKTMLDVTDPEAIYWIDTRDVITDTDI